MGQIRISRPSPAILVAVLALIAAVAGTAVAGPVATKKAVTKKKVKKIADAEINKLAPGLSVANAANATNATNATNAAALGGQSAADLQSVGRSNSSTGVCDPGSTTFITCGSVDLGLPSAGRVLVVGDIGWYVNGAPSRGRCSFNVDGAGGAIAVEVGETTATTDITHESSRGLNGVTGVLSAGPHTANIACNQEEGDILYRGFHLSAVRLGAG
jgi:hypothetical protein